MTRDQQQQQQQRDVTCGMTRDMASGTACGMLVVAVGWRV